MIEGPRRPPSAPVGRRIDPYGESQWMIFPSLIHRAFAYQLLATTLRPEIFLLLHAAPCSFCLSPPWVSFFFLPRAYLIPHLFGTCIYSSVPSTALFFSTPLFFLFSSTLQKFPFVVDFLCSCSACLIHLFSCRNSPECSIPLIILHGVGTTCLYFLNTYSSFFASHSLYCGVVMGRILGIMQEMFERKAIHLKYIGIFLQDKNSFRRELCWAFVVD